MRAEYVSIWDGSTEVRTGCDFNPQTKDVTDIEVADVEGMDLDILFEEYIELPNGERITEFTIEGEERE